MKISTLVAGVAFAAFLAWNFNPSDASASAPTVTALPQASTSDDAIALGKTYDCGGKGQKPCPMQGWMKSVLGAAAGSGDAKQLAKALKEVASKPVAGFDQWVAISTEGAAKADAGDVDGAKQSCKKCHSLYQKKYREEMRDKPW